MAVTVKMRSACRLTQTGFRSWLLLFATKPNCINLEKASAPPG